MNKSSFLLLALCCVGFEYLANISSHTTRWLGHKEFIGIAKKHPDLPVWVDRDLVARQDLNKSTTIKVQLPEITWLETESAKINLMYHRDNRLIQICKDYFLHIAFFVWFAFTAHKTTSGSSLGGLVSSVNITKPDKSITVQDVGGLFETKLELTELFDVMRNPKEYEKLGGRFPRGALLEGPPGTGKTMIARALASEFDFSFLVVSGSDLIKPFVGTGSMQVKQIYDKARTHSPCIVFIDELDAIGGKRSTTESVSGGSSERENILNSLLVELDGFDQHKNAMVFTIGATNRKSVLDKALVRPGRLDRIVSFHLPDLEERIDILSTYTKKFKLEIGLLDSAEFWHSIAQRTVGWSGAKLHQLFNEAATISFGLKHEHIFRENVENAFDQIVMGKPKQRKLLDVEKKRVAVHESGHAVVSRVLFDEDKSNNRPVRVTIVPHTKGALGVTMIEPFVDKILDTLEDYSSQLMVLLGGRLAEELLLGSISDGASDDLSRAYGLARQMVTKLGMTSSPGQKTENIVQVDPDSSTRHGPNWSNMIDSAVEKHIKDCEAKTRKLLSTHKAMVQKLADQLLIHNTIDHAKLHDIFASFGLSGKK